VLEPLLQSFFALIILEIGSCFSPRLARTVILLFFTSCHRWDDRQAWDTMPSFFPL
jgi:hypothetical protein